MILLALLVVGLLVAGVVALGGGTLAAGRDGGRLARGLSVSLGTAAAAIVALLVVLLGAAAIVGLGRSADDDPGAADLPEREEPAARDTTAPDPGEDEEGVAAGQQAPVRRTHGVPLGPLVRMTPTGDAPDSEDFPQPTTAVGRLADPTVLQVRVSGFPPFTRARAAQCAVTPSGVACANTIRVQFGEDGSASFQYLVTADAGGAAGASCDLAGPTCSLVVSDLEGSFRAERATVFGDPAPTSGRVRVEPRSQLVDGQPVTVVVSGFPAGARARAVICAAPGTGEQERCGAPGPVAQFTVGHDGTATVDLPIEAGPVGTERHRCGHDAICGVAVVADGGVKAPVVPISYAGLAGADYEGGRLMAGLAAAVAIALALAWLVFRTDWTPVGEERAPEIDDAVYADLDAIVAALPPEEPEVDLEPAEDDEMLGADRFR